MKKMDRIAICRRLFECGRAKRMVVYIVTVVVHFRWWNVNNCIVEAGSFAGWRVVGVKMRCSFVYLILVAAMKVFTLTIVGRERSPPVSIVGRCNGVSTNWCINLQNHTVVSKFIYVKKAHIFGGRTLNFLIYFPWKWMKISWFAGFYYCAFTFGVPFSV